jgi:SAM-dependent methyltransferase
LADRLFEDAQLAALYDSMCPRAERWDFDFYLPMVMSAPAVLDVGCGTGMMLHEARDAGHAGRLCGLDPAAGMLAQARRRADVEWVEGDLVSAGFEAQFDLIVMTGHAFQVLVEDAEIEAALAAARRALRPGGRFAFETRNPAARAWESWTIRHPVRMTAPDGHQAMMTRQVTAPFDGRTVAFTHTFEADGWPEPVVSRSTLRFLDLAELDAFLGAAGFRVAALYGDWDGSTLAETSPEIIVIAD